MGAGTTSLEEINLYVKAGVDGERLGACPFCQRVFMVLLIKARHNLLKFKVRLKKKIHIYIFFLNHSVDMFQLAFDNE